MATHKNSAATKTPAPAKKATRISPKFDAAKSKSVRARKNAAAKVRRGVVAAPKQISAMRTTVNNSVAIVKTNPLKFNAAHQLAVLRTHMQQAYLHGQPELLTKEDKKLIAEFDKMTPAQKAARIEDLSKSYRKK
jgi:hypothetical protein